MAQDTTTENYAYDDELDDSVDTLSFGKFAARTPLWVAKNYPAYLVWCWENTSRWVGSEDLVRKCYDLIKKKFKPRNQIKLAPTPALSSDYDTVVASFEQAMYEAYDCFPKPTYIRN